MRYYVSFSRASSAHKFLTAMQYNGIELRRVPRESTDGSQLFCSFDGTTARKLLKNGSWSNVNGTPTTCENCKVKYNANRKQRYLQYKDALGWHKPIYVSHAVYLAWVGPIPEGMVIDHLNGITTDNRADNLEPVTPSENSRRARYLRVMRDCGFDPRIFSAKDFQYWFSMPFDEFKTFFNHYKND